MQIIRSFLKTLTRKSVIGFFTLLSIIVISVLGFFFRESFLGNIFQHTPLVFQVESANFDISRGLIPFNAKSIDIYFSDDIHPDDVDINNFTIDPFIDGYLTLKDKRILSYVIQGELEVGNYHTLTISGDIRSKNELAFGTDLVLDLEIVAGAEVVSVTPTGELENLSQAVHVFFNMPMVPLTNLSERDNLPCPLSIEPQLEGRCHWLTTSVVEFLPEDFFRGASTYTLSVTNTDGLNYQLQDDYDFQIQTPDLDITVDESFAVQDGIMLISNFQISKETLKSHITLSSNNINIGDLDIEEEQKGLRFRIMPKNTSFLYNTGYQIRISEGLPSLYGTNPLSRERSFGVRSKSFLSDVVPYREIYSQTGVLIDTQRYQDATIPIENVFFQMSFLEEVALNKDFFELKGDDAIIDFSLSYAQRRDEDGAEMEDKTRINLRVEKRLDHNTYYTLRIRENANAHLDSDITKVYISSEQLRLVESRFNEYKSFCIYVNNPLYRFGANNVRSIPSSFNTYIHSVSSNTHHFGRNPCHRLPRGGEYAYHIRTQLEPEASVELILQDIEDIYGNTVKELYRATHITGKIQESDRRVQSALQNTYNTFPQHLEKLIHLQSAQTDTLYVDICEMNDENMMHYRYNHWRDKFTLKCNKKSSQELSVINKGWIIENTYFDIEKDILKRDKQYPHLLLEFYASAEKTKNLSRVSRVFTSTDISLYLEQGANMAVVFPLTLDGHRFISDLKLDFFDNDRNKVNFPYSYNTQTGGYDIDGNLENISYIRAYNAELHGIISTSGDEYYNRDFRDVSWNDTSSEHFLYLYTDKPIYKPSEKVHIKGLLRKFHYDGYTPSPIRSGNIVIRDNRWEELLRIPVQIDQNSNFESSFILPEEMSLGYYSIRFEGDKKENNLSIHSTEVLHVEEYETPTFRVALSDATSSDSVLLGDTIDVTILPEYYFGGKIRNTSGKYRVMSQNYFFNARDYAAYQFGEGFGYHNCIYWGFCSPSDWSIASGEFQIDALGQGDFSFPLADQLGEKIYSFSFTVTDPQSQRDVTNTFSKVVHNTDGYVGLQSRYFHELDDGIPVDIVTLNSDASIKANTSVTLELTKIDWKQVREKGVDGVFYNSYSRHEELVKEKTIRTDNLGELSLTLRPEVSGQYELRAIYTGSNNESFESVISLYVSGREFTSWRNDNNTLTELSPEKLAYSIGETAEFILQSPVDSGRAVFFIEKDDGILDYFSHSITSYGEKITFTVQENYYPNVYIKGFLIGTKPGDTYPTFRRALGSIRVNTDHKNFRVSLSTDKEAYNPGDAVEITLRVEDNEGRPVPNVNGSLAVVDESVLALKGNPRRNPFVYFYEMKRYLGVRTFVNLRNIVDILEIGQVTSGQKGGSGNNQMIGDTEKPRGDFRDVAYWEANFQTNQQGVAVLQIDALPDNLTTWVAEAIVNTTSDTRVGAGYTTFTTSKDVMIQEHLPRFFASGDSITIAPVIHNRSGVSQEFDVTLEASNADIEINQQQVYIEEDASKRVTFHIQIRDINEIDDLISQLQIRAVGRTTSISDATQRYIPITLSQTPETVTTRGRTSGVSHSETITLGNDVLRDGAVIDLNYSGTLFTHFLESISTDATIFFNSQSSSHKTSILSPFIQKKKLYNILEKEYNFADISVTRFRNSFEGNQEIRLDEVMQIYLTEIGGFQNNDGGFRFFQEQGNKTSHYGLSVQILSNLADMRSIGLNVPPQILSSGVIYLKKNIQNTPSCEEGVWRNCLSRISKIEGLITLLEMNPNDGEVHSIFQVLDFDTEMMRPSEKLTKAQLLSRLIDIDSLGQETRTLYIQRAQDIVQDVLNNQLVYNPRGAFIGRDTSHGRLRNTTLLLDVIAGIGFESFQNIQDIQDNTIRFLTGYVSDNTLFHFESVESFKSLVHYISRSDELTQTDLVANIRVNNEIIAETSIDRDTIFETYHRSIDLPSLGEKIEFKADVLGEGSLYYDLTLSYFVEIDDVPARDEGFHIQREFYAYESYKQIHDKKEAEYRKYLEGELTFEELTYKREVVEYLEPIDTLQVGELILVYNRIITAVPRDNVNIQAFIPSGSELVNMRLDTEEQGLVGIGSSFRKEFENLRNERYEAFTSHLNTGVHNFSYILRATHSGSFELRPTVVQELRNPEVFGRTAGARFVID